MRAIRLPRAVAVLALLAWAGPSALADLKRPAVKPLAAPAPPSGFRALADVPEVEPNNDPSQAQPVGCGNSLRPASLTNVGAAPDSDWISFTAAAGDLVTFETADDGGLTDTIIHLFADDGVTVLAANDDAPGTLFSRIADFSAPYTGLYYGRVRGFLGAEGPYRANVACVPPPPPPVNDRCDGAVAIPAGAIDLSGTTRFATNDYDLCPGVPVCGGSCTGFHSPGRDVVYRLEVARAGDVLSVTYDLDPRATDASIYVVTDCGDVLRSCVAGRDSDTGTPPEELTFAFSAPGTYFLILDAFTEGGAAWTLRGCLACPTAARPLTWGSLKAIYR